MSNITLNAQRMTVRATANSSLFASCKKAEPFNNFALTVPLNLAKRQASSRLLTVERAGHGTCFLHVRTVATRDHLHLDAKFQVMNDIFRAKTRQNSAYAQTAHVVAQCALPLVHPKDGLDHRVVVATSIHNVRCTRRFTEDPVLLGHYLSRSCMEQ